MALSTLEKQRLRAALNNTPLANRIEKMLNYVDDYSDDSTPVPGILKVVLSSEFHSFSCDEGAAFSEDLSALLHGLSGQATQWDIVMPFGFEAVDNAGTFSGTAPAFTGGTDIYGFTVVVSNNFNYKVISVSMTVNDV